MRDKFHSHSLSGPARRPVRPSVCARDGIKLDYVNKERVSFGRCAVARRVASLRLASRRPVSCGPSDRSTNQSHAHVSALCRRHTQCSNLVFKFRAKPNRPAAAPARSAAAASARAQVGAHFRFAVRSVAAAAVAAADCGALPRGAGYVRLNKFVCARARASNSSAPPRRDCVRVSSSDAAAAAAPRERAICFH